MPEHPELFQGLFSGKHGSYSLTIMAKKFEYGVDKMKHHIHAVDDQLNNTK